MEKKMPTIQEVIRLCEKEISYNPTNPYVLIKVPTETYKKSIKPADGNVIHFNHSFAIRPEIIAQNAKSMTLKFNAKVLLRAITHGASQPFVALRK